MRWRAHSARDLPNRLPPMRALDHRRHRAGRALPGPLLLVRGLRRRRARTARNRTRCPARSPPSSTVTADLRDRRRAGRRGRARPAPTRSTTSRRRRSSPASYDDPQGTIDQIAGATRTVLAAAGDARVFVAASSEVFGDAGVSPQSEDSPMRPTNPYGEAKLAAHRAVGEARAGGRVRGAAASRTTTSRRAGRSGSCRARSASGWRGSLPGRPTSSSSATSTRSATGALRPTSCARCRWRCAMTSRWTTSWPAASGARCASSWRPRSRHAGLDWERYVRVDDALVRPAARHRPHRRPSRARRVLGWEPSTTFEQLIGEMVDADRERLGGAG